MELSQKSLVLDGFQIEWSVRGGGALRNIESARISVPSTLKYNSDRKWYFNSIGL